MSLALPFALLALGGGFVWAATRKPKPPASSTTPLALPPGPMPGPTVPTPSPTAAPPVLDQAQQLLTQYALDPGMPSDLAGQVARVLSAEGDPTKLDGWASQLDQLGFPKAAQALRAKSSALRAVQGAGTALGRINDVLTNQPTGTPGISPDPAQVRQQAQNVVTQAAQVATQQPTATDAAAAAARAAAAAARAATTGNPDDVQRAAKEAATAASTVMSPIAQSKASAAVIAAQTAIATGSPTAAVEAASKAAEAASQVLQDATKIVVPAPAPMPGASTAPTAPGDADARALAQLVAADIRAKGCWHENRDLVKQFQQLVYPAAGTVDGFYGPSVAIAMAKYLPKVPAPCYWPKASADRTKAKADWAAMVKNANINVGRLWMGG